MLRAIAYSIKSTDQITQAGSPLYPADPLTFSYQGEDLTVYPVPIDGVVRELALLEPGRKQSTFIDPAAPDAAPIVWAGLVADPGSRVGLRAPLGELRRRSGT